MFKYCREVKSLVFRIILISLVRFVREVWWELKIEGDRVLKSLVMKEIEEKG